MDEKIYIISKINKENNLTEKMWKSNDIDEVVKFVDYFNKIDEKYIYVYQEPNDLPKLTNKAI